MSAAEEERDTDWDDDDDDDESAATWAEKEWRTQRGCAPGEREHV